MSTSGRTSRAKTAPAGPLPLFGVEIEIYVKLRPDLEQSIRERRYRDARSMPLYWLDWDFDLENGQGNLERKAKQRDCVGQAVREIIDVTLGAGHGWTCESDASLKEWALTEPPDVRKWWGIEIISPPMSVTKHWQDEIDLIFQAVGRHFDFWTNECCACHVHVSPGPTKQSKYTTPQLVRMAKGAFFWEEAFKELLPPERRNNRYALANHTLFATFETANVPNKGWGPVFSKIGSVASLSLDAFIQEMKGGTNETRYVSTSFHPFTRLGTVELRRQAGVASAMTAIHRILFALTLHVSAFRYNFDEVKTRKTRPDAAELIRELAGCIKKLPSETCHGSRFVNFLYWCQESYAGNKCFTEKQINAREKALRDGKAPPNQRSGPAPPPLNAASATTTTTTNTAPPPLPRVAAVSTTLPSRPAPPRSTTGGGSTPSRTSNPRPPPASTRRDTPRAIVRSQVGTRTVYEIR